jgi:hypothetical protein
MITALMWPASAVSQPSAATRGRHPVSQGNSAGPGGTQFAVSAALDDPRRLRSAALAKQAHAARVKFIADQRRAARLLRAQLRAAAHRAAAHRAAIRRAQWLAAQRRAAARRAAERRAAARRAARQRAAHPSGSPQQIASAMLGNYGWGQDQFGCLVSLWNQESGWNPSALNASSGAYGIPQSLPADKMASVGADWQTNPATQIRWGLGYIQQVYGTPCGAWSHEMAYNWY